MGMGHDDWLQKIDESMVPHLRPVSAWETSGAISQEDPGSSP